MFDFENLTVYQKAKSINKEIVHLLSNSKGIDTPMRNQLRRACLSIPVNIAEGSGRFSKADKKNFYIIARGSVYECVALLDIMKDEGHIEADKFNELYGKFEELSKMLFALIQSQAGR